MNDSFAENFLCYLIFVGFYQILLAFIVAGTILPIICHFVRVEILRALRQFALFNFFLLGWGGIGNFFWIRLTFKRLDVADDAPVWAPFIPFGTWVLDHAAGFRDGWHLLGDTSLFQLQTIWAATAIPVWLLSILSLRLCSRLFSRRTA